MNPNHQKTNNSYILHHPSSPPTSKPYQRITIPTNNSSLRRRRLHGRFRQQQLHPTIFRSNHMHPPYGKSFPAKLPTGRFSNGKLATDFLGPSLGLKPTGVSFASAGGGLNDRTAMLSLTLTMDRQWRFFEEAVHKMKSVVGDSETNRVIKNALFVISAGTNDMIYNVYDHVPRSFISVSDYQDYLLNTIESFC